MHGMRQTVHRRERMAHENYHDDNDADDDDDDFIFLAT